MEENFCIIIYLKASTKEDFNTLLEAATDNIKDNWIKPIELKNEAENAIILIRFLKHSRALRLEKSMTAAKLKCSDPSKAIFDIYHLLVNMKSKKTVLIN